MTPRRAKAHRVVTVVDRHVAMFELAVPCEVFGIDRSELVDPWYEHIICSPEPGPIDTGQGAVVVVENGLDALSRADTVVLIPPWSSHERDPSPDLLEALRRAHRRG